MPTAALDHANAQLAKKLGVASPRLVRADALIAEQRAKLEAVIAGSAWPEIKSQARHYLAKVAYWERQPEQARESALGELGGNAYGVSIDDVVRQAQMAAAIDQSRACDARCLDAVEELRAIRSRKAA